MPLISRRKTYKNKSLTGKSKYIIGLDQSLIAGMKVKRQKQ